MADEKEKGGKEKESCIYWDRFNFCRQVSFDGCTWRWGGVRGLVRLSVVACGSGMVPSSGTVWVWYWCFVVGGTVPVGVAGLATLVGLGIWDWYKYEYPGSPQLG